MVRRVFEPEEFERSAAAGDPRLEPDFAGDTDAWRSHQDQWFTTFTGEALPPVGDLNRALRWKASKRQRKAIEEARLKDAISVDGKYTHNDGPTGSTPTTTGRRTGTTRHGARSDTSTARRRRRSRGPTRRRTSGRSSFS